MTNEIPQDKLDWLNQLSAQTGTDINLLKKYYTEKINDITFINAFPKIDELYDYVDILIADHIHQLNSAVMTTYEVVILVSSSPKVSKAENVYNNHVVMAKLPGDGQKVKFMNIRNNEEYGKVEKYEALSTGLINVNVTSENDLQIDASSKINTEFKIQPLTWVPNTMAEKKEWIKRSLKQFTIATAEKCLSIKTQDGKGVNPCSLRWIQGNISTHRIVEKTDEKTGQKRVTGIINIMDKSAATIPDFTKSKTVPDPKNPGKTMTEYGGFSAFVDPEDIRLIGKGSECIFIGTLATPRMMNIGTIIPILAIAPKKPTEKLQKPGNPTPPPTQDASVNPTML